MGPKDSNECQITLSFKGDVIGTLNTIDFTLVSKNRELELKDKETRDAKNDQNR